MNAELNRRMFFKGAAAYALAGFAPVGSAATRVDDETWSDLSRGRDLPLRIRWPSQTAAKAVSVILFSHGLGGSRDGGALWGEAWAAAGFAVIHLQHPGSDTPAARANLREAMAPRQLINRLEDVRFVLDEVARRHASGVPGWRDLDASRVGMSGHSFGAHTTLGMAGQSYPGFQRVLEPRLAAFLALSPAVPSVDPVKAFSGVTRPILCMTGSLDGDVVGNGASPESRRAVYAALPAGQKAMLVLADADHMTFAGQAGRSIEIVPRQAVSREKQAAHHAVVAQISSDWWRSKLMSDADATARLRAPAALDVNDEWLQG
jgi:predicted dienelactone hydrolase